MALETIFFDSDGVLWDNQDSCIQQFGKILNLLGIDRDPSQVWSQVHYGYPIREIIKLSLKKPFQLITNARQIRRVTKQSHDHAMRGAQPFFEPEQYNDLAQRYPVVVVTQNEERQTRKAFETYGMNTPEAIYAGGTVRKRTKLARALKERGLASSQTVFVTDTIGDVIEAGHPKTNIKTYGVRWGLHGNIIEEEAKKRKMKNYQGTFEQPKTLVEYFLNGKE